MYFNPYHKIAPGPLRNLIDTYELWLETRPYDLSHILYGDIEEYLEELFRLLKVELDEDRHFGYPNGPDIA